MASDTHTSVKSGAWTATDTWDKAAKPADDDVVVIAAGHTVTYDEDMTAWTYGVRSLTITSHATTPAMLVANTAASSFLMIKAGGSILGTNAAAKGRLLANSDATWGHTGPLAYAKKFVISLLTTATIDATYLDINLRCVESTNKYVTVYTNKKTVSDVNTGTDVLTSAGHGWTDTTPVMVRSSGTLPAPLIANTPYYVRDKTTDTLKLTSISGGTAIDITSTGSGTIELYDGVATGSSATLSVLEDVSADSWTAGDSVVLVDCNDSAGYDQQRLTIAAGGIASGALTLSAGTDSAQLPGARVYLMSRNVAIRSSCVTSANIVNAAVNGYFGCEIRSTAGTGTTVYGNGLYGGVGNTVSGTVSGCTNVLSSGTGNSVTGIVCGCSTAIASTSTGNVITGTISGCSVVFASTSTGNVITGIVSGCNYVSSGSNSNAVGCTISGCYAGLYGGSAFLVGAVFFGNTYDLYNCVTTGTATLGSVVQNGFYKHASLKMAEVRWAALVENLGGVAGAIGCWTQGGYAKSAAYASGTHGTPPVATTLVHEQTFEDSDRVCYVELPIRAPAGSPVTVTVYGKLTTTSGWTTRPSVGIYDPAQPWQSDTLNASDPIANDTDWHTLTATYTSTTERELRVRVQGIGGAADGTGTGKLYWFGTIAIGSAGGGATSVIGSRFIRGIGAL